MLYHHRRWIIVDSDGCMNLKKIHLAQIWPLKSQLTYVSVKNFLQEARSNMAWMMMSGW